ncbi:MAG: bacterial proteasome activator family protein [Aeromicrobium sp.]|uniref:bacterial proteasome activator family protein n=1 Tax=Aeromicrobium sp. TaxID=1871063 RepID=UPI0039E3B71D
MTDETPLTIGPDGSPVEPAAIEPAESAAPTSVADLVEQPAKVMRIGGMIRQLLEEVKAAPLDEPSRARLREIHEQSVAELKDGLAPELVEELSRLSQPFEAASPSEGELRIAQAQLVGWLEGLFHGIQAALYAQQVQAQSQLQTMRLALPQPSDGAERTQSQPTEGSGTQNGMYL